MATPNLELVATLDLVEELERRSTAHFIVLLGSGEATKTVGKQPEDSAECFATTEGDHVHELDDAVEQWLEKWRGSLE